MQQDRDNSLIIEKGFQYFKDNQLLKKDKANLQTALAMSDSMLATTHDLLKEAEFRNKNEILARQEALILANVYKKKARKQKTLKVLSIIILGSLLILSNI